MDVFNFMLDNDIGTSLAILYKSYADHLELAGSTKKADEIYNLGVNRNAEPLQLLTQFKRFSFLFLLNKFNNSTFYPKLIRVTC